MSCDYMGKDFGSPYIDSRCIDGFLSDCDGDGEVSDIPCPVCNHAEWLEYFLESIEVRGYEAAEVGKPRECDIKPKYTEDMEKIKTWWLEGYDNAKNDGDVKL